MIAEARSGRARAVSSGQPLRIFQLARQGTISLERRKRDCLGIFLARL